MLGLKIAYYRKAKGLTQEQLAESLGISVGSLSAIEAPATRRGISFDLFFDIADHLDVSPYRLLQFDE